MFGIKYSQQNPVNIFQQQSRLTIYKFRFKNVHGTRRVIDESQKQF